MTRPATPSAITPGRVCAARLLNRSPGAETVERAVGLAAACAALADLQAHAHRCEAFILASGAGVAFYPIIASISTFIDAKLSRMEGGL